MSDTKIVQDGESVATATTANAGEVQAPLRPTGVAAPTEERSAPPAPQRDEERPLPALPTTGAAALSAAAAAWMVSGAFSGVAAHWCALLGVLIGGGMIALGQRMRSGIPAYLVAPLAGLVGAILVAPDTGGSTGLAAQIGEAVKNGGLLQPPVSFDPGWRFVLVVLFALLTAGAAAVASSTRRPKLGVLLPMPLTLLAALVQPDSAEIVNVVVAVVFAASAMTVAYGAQLAADGELGAGFESRRILRGIALAVALAVGLGVVSKASFLFPQPDRSHVVPPQRPPTPPDPPDRVLFSYTASRPGLPLDLGVIDVYDVKAGAWELPPYDPSRFDVLHPPQTIPGTTAGGRLPTATATVTMVNADGHSLLALAGVSRISGTDQVVDYDPRTQELRLAEKPVYDGLRYTVVGLAPPTGRELGTAPPAGPAFQQFLVAPKMPAQVSQLLDKYANLAIKENVPQDAFDRLQYLRQALYDKVVAAGAGKPVDVSAQRVVQMLGGANASPYEITAAEALLARWAGVPSRMAYGYFGGDRQPDGSYQVRPRNASTWLEVYFPGYGWVPIVGTPPKAQPSLSTKPKNDVNAQVSDQLALVVYIPTRHPSFLALYEYVRWYLERVGPIVAGLALLVACYPFALKRLRSRRRRKWARARGYAARIGVAYCELRDAARDLAIGNPAATPIAFLGAVADDPEHAELAWLVSRTLWGDLRRDLRIEDVEAAERLAASVRRRLVRAQPGLSIVLGAIARTSLRDPYSRDIPNLWRELPGLRGVLDTLAPWRNRRGGGRAVRRRTAVALGAAGLLAMLLTTCGGAAGGAASKPAVPADLVPAALGRLHFQREPVAEAQFAKAGADSLVTGGRVYTVRHDDVVEGDVQVERFTSDVDTEDLQDSRTVYCTENSDDCSGDQAFKGIQADIGNSRFQRVYVDGWRGYLMTLSDQRIYLWFPPHTQTMVLMVLRSGFTQQSSDALFHALVDSEQHRTPVSVPIPNEAGQS